MRKATLIFPLALADFSAYRASMEDTLRTHLLDLTRAFGEATKASPATIGKRALNDNTVLARIAAGDMGFNIRTYDRLVRWFARNWPEDTDWPEDVQRPALIGHTRTAPFPNSEAAE
jgi:hypothetical protein